MKYSRLLLCLLSLFLIGLLTACADAGTAPPGGGNAASTHNLSATPAQAGTGTFQEITLPQNDSGLMRPVLDARGRIWFGEMSRNYLGSFDPPANKFWQQTPPAGKSGIMGLAVAPDNTIWFAEQYSNYIGHYFPTSGRYKTYPLPMINAPDPSAAGKTLNLPSAPNDIVLDNHGILWFTELNANAIGSLNTTTGALHHYLLAPAKAQDLNPYGITADAQGVIWFTEASSNRLGRLDPVSGSVRYFTPPGVTAPLMELVSDASGQVWATTFNTGLLLRFAPATSSFTVYTAPALNGDPGALYGLTVASNGDIWVAITAANMLARLDIKAQRFLYYTIPTAASLPLGLVEGADHSIWFTESGSNKLGRLQAQG
jgi:streptogramin lyase